MLPQACRLRRPLGCALVPPACAVQAAVASAPCPAPRTMSTRTQRPSWQRRACRTSEGHRGTASMEQRAIRWRRGGGRPGGHLHGTALPTHIAALRRFVASTYPFNLACACMKLGAGRWVHGGKAQPPPQTAGWRAALAFFRFASSSPRTVISRASETSQAQGRGYHDAACNRASSCAPRHLAQRSGSPPACMRHYQRRALPDQRWAGGAPRQARRREASLLPPP